MNDNEDFAWKLRLGDLNKSELEVVCREFAGAFQGLLSWQWDARFEMALTEFSTDKKDHVQPILTRHLSNRWDSENIGKASATVKMIDNHFGGLRSGQLLYTSDPNLDFFIYGVLWSWGDGATASFRVGPYDKRISDSEKDKLDTLFKGWFGL